MKKKNVVLSLIPSEKTRHILYRLGYINANGKTISERGLFQVFLNECIESRFRYHEAMEMDWMLHLMNRELDEVKKHQKKANELGIERARLIQKQSEKRQDAFQEKIIFN